MLPQAALLALGEVLVALLARERERARAVVGAWNWNARRLTEISLLRGELAEHRLFPDSEVRRLQLRGSARLSRYLSRLSHQGLEAANSVAVACGRADRDDERAEVAVLTGSVGLAFSEDSDFDELDDLGRRAGRDRFGRRVRRAAQHRAPARHGVARGAVRDRHRDPRAVLRLAAAGGSARPVAVVVDDLAPLLLGLAVRRGGDHGTRVARLRGLRRRRDRALRGHGHAAARPALGLHPARRVRPVEVQGPLVSPRARVVAVICYLGLPLPYGSLGAGRWDGLIVYALFPFIARRLAGAAGVEPFAVEPGTRWRTRPAGQVAMLGALVAVGTSFAPVLAPLVLVAALAWVAGSFLVGARDADWRPLAVAGAAVGVALVLLAPWVVGTALVGKGSVAIFGLPISGATAPNWGELVRFAIGPVARSPLVWLLIAAAALPLAIGRGVRLVWAARLWVMACRSWGFALAAVRGDMGSFAPSAPVVLAPAALAVAACLGLGISSFENDLSGRQFRLAAGGRRGGPRLRRRRPPSRGRRCSERPLEPPRPGRRTAAVLPRSSGRQPDGAGAVARRPQGAPGRRLVDRTRAGLRARRPPACRTRRRCSHQQVPGPRPRGAGGAARDDRRNRAPGPARRRRGRALRRARSGPGALDGRFASADRQRPPAAGPPDRSARAGRPAPRSRRRRHLGVRERRGDAGHGATGRPAARGRAMVLSERGRRGRVATRAGLAVRVGRCVRPRPDRHRLRRVRARRGLRPDRRRPFRPPAARVRLGGAVRHHPGNAELSLSQFPYVPLAVLAEVAVWVVLLAALVGRRRRPPPAHRSAS